MLDFVDEEVGDVNAAEGIERDGDRPMLDAAKTDKNTRRRLDSIFNA